MRRFKPDDYVFWLAFQPKLTGIYRYINDDKYPRILLRKDGNPRDFLAGEGAIFTLRELEIIMNHPDLEQFFTVEKIIEEKEREIENLRFKLGKKHPRKKKR